LAEALETKYGKPRKLDRCAGAACEPEYWAMSMGFGERVYAYLWENIHNSSGIRNVSVGIQATNLAEPYLRLDYEVNDEAKCKAAQKSNDAKSL
jgi:hypothetical protein